MVIQCKDGRRVKASDISDEQFIAALPTEPYKTISLTALEEALPYPWKVVLAKARTLITKNRGVHGCFCGCGGSFHRAELCNASCMQGYVKPIERQPMSYEKYLSDIDRQTVSYMDNMRYEPPKLTMDDMLDTLIAARNLYPPKPDRREPLYISQGLYDQAAALGWDMTYYAVPLSLDSMSELEKAKPHKIKGVSPSQTIIDEANHISSAGLTSMAGTVGFDLHPWQKDWIDYVMSNDPDVKINYRKRGK